MTGALAITETVYTAVYRAMDYAVVIAASEATSEYVDTAPRAVWSIGVTNQVHGVASSLHYAVRAAVREAVRAIGPQL